MKRLAVSALSLFLLAGCSRARATTAPVLPGESSRSAATEARQPAPPAFLLGSFEDDYGGQFSISASEFVQLPRSHFHIVKWDVSNQYFIAHNDSLNRSDPNRWTRVDWMPLNDMAPYAWAFCFSAYNADTRAAADATVIANRAAPRTGCNGFPFTRMKLLIKR